MKNEAASIKILERLGAVIKPFSVRSIAFSGLVVRFDNDQRAVDGLISEVACQNLKQLSDSARVLLELRLVQLDASDASRIARLDSLAGLDLAGASADGAATDGDLLNVLPRLKNLTILDLGLRPRTAADLAPLAALMELRRLCLSEAELDDEALGPLAKLTGLRELFILGHRASPEAVANLRRELPACRIVC